MLAKAKGAVSEKARAAAARAEAAATQQVEAHLKTSAARVQSNAEGSIGGRGDVVSKVSNVALAASAAAVGAAASTIAPGVVSMVKQSYEDVPVPPPTCWCGVTPLEPGCAATTTKVACFVPALVTHVLGSFAYAATASVNCAILGALCLCPTCCCGDTRKRVSKTHGRMLSWLKNNKHGRPWVTSHILRAARDDPQTGCLEGCHYAIMQCQLANGTPDDVIGQCCDSCCSEDPRDRFKSGQYYGHGVAAPCQVCLLDNSEQI